METRRQEANVETLGTQGRTERDRGIIKFCTSIWCISDWRGIFDIATTPTTTTTPRLGHAQVGEVKPSKLFSHYLNRFTLSVLSPFETVHVSRQCPPCVSLSLFRPPLYLDRLITPPPDSPVGLKRRSTCCLAISLSSVRHHIHT